jgi:F-type H+-transporting ATPase subunit gamma
MPSLKTLKQRIHSVQSTRKITSAMKMVATSYYRRYQATLSPLQQRFNSLTDHINSVLPEISLDSQAPALLTGRTKTKKHVIVSIGSSRGLCGSFNGKILSHILDLQKNLLEVDLSVSLFCLGPKLFSIANSLPGFEKVWYCPIDYKNTALQAEVISLYLKTLFNDHQIDACTLVYAAHESALSFNPIQIPLFPLKSVSHPKKEGSTTPLFGIEPDSETLLTHLCHARIEAAMLMGIVESKASEESTRMVAMENATKNADDMIRKLNITYNRTRQASITKELIEIISGAEAL